MLHFDLHYEYPPHEELGDLQAIEDQLQRRDCKLFLQLVGNFGTEVVVWNIRGIDYKPT